MKTTELAALIGEKTYAVADAVRCGRLKAEKVPDPKAPGGARWEITTPLEEARAIMAARERRASPVRRTPAVLALLPLPAHKDLFKPEEAARAAGVNVSTYYKFVKDQKVEPMRNGRSSYVTRAVVERMREHFRPVPPPPAAAEPTQQRLALPDPRLDRIERKLDETLAFLRNFAATVGYKAE